MQFNTVYTQIVGLRGVTYIWTIKAGVKHLLPIISPNRLVVVPLEEDGDLIVKDVLLQVVWITKNYVQVDQDTNLVNMM